MIAIERRDTKSTATDSKVITNDTSISISCIEALHDLRAAFDRGKRRPRAPEDDCVMESDSPFSRSTFYSTVFGRSFAPQMEYKNMRRRRKKAITIKRQELFICISLIPFAGRALFFPRVAK